MASINKLELVNELAERLGVSKVEAERNLTALQEIIVENVVEGNEVSFPGSFTCTLPHRKLAL